VIIAISSDHAGFELKQALVAALRGDGHDVQDLGPTTIDPDDDYPELVAPVARLVAGDPARVRGIVIGGSGQGEAIVANRFPGVRAALYYGGPLEIIHLSREHNDANVLSLGARFLTVTEAETAVRAWLEMDGPCSGDRHERRVQLIEKVRI
jgi:ribose 5-phosphate isomerase B